MISDQPRIGDLVFASRSGGTPIVGYRKRWLNIAKLDDLPANITSHMLRHGFASLAADLGSRPCRETDPSPLMDTSEHGFRSCYHPTRDQSHQRMRKAARTAPKPWRMRTRGASSRPASTRRTPCPALSLRFAFPSCPHGRCREPGQQRQWLATGEAGPPAWSSSVSPSFAKRLCKPCEFRSVPYRCQGPGRRHEHGPRRRQGRLPGTWGHHRLPPLADTPWAALQRRD
jgi:hypothetical protein